ncbi:MAG: hypothetical protein EOP83_30315 [Verrucomicrobiaceae bacterium]|nr:MAG: hypothetical protein EOP83_30315 [Verrucomicrobiaceae bacterium]
MKKKDRVSKRPSNRVKSQVTNLPTNPVKTPEPGKATSPPKPLARSPAKPREKEKARERERKVPDKVKEGANPKWLEMARAPAKAKETNLPTSLRDPRDKLPVRTSLRARVI